MILRKLLNRQKMKKRAVITYFVEISLIILSILIAIQADRYNQSRKDQKKLKNYLESTYQDLLDEQEQNQLNLADCQSDIAHLYKSSRLSRYNQDDSLQLALSSLKIVFSRGVFRAFPPTTFDIMTSNGDISLIKDLDFRKMLASAFSFRDTYVRKDLQEFDAQTKEVGRELAEFIDLECLATSDQLFLCLTDKEGFVKDFHNEIFIFLRQAQIRAFHLNIAISYFDYTIKDMEQLYDFLEKGADDLE